MATKKVRCTVCNGSGVVTRIRKTATSCGIARVTCPRCHGTGLKEVPMSNADKIRAMSDEDLAAWIASMTTVCECCAELNECESPRGFNRCSHGVEDWLKQPAEEET